MSAQPSLSGFTADALIQALGPGACAYVVGGAVRDELLGLPAADRDWVVTGTTPEQMVAAGFTPVGADFPVFLHPLTQEEFALARTERKTAPGYGGFVFHTSPDVTLEQDLLRRDLTINAMAMDAQGYLIDPWGGLADLRARVLRHVSPAFSEDPVRLLRLARFAARFPDFGLAPETLRFCIDMVNRGEVAALVAERVWQEVARLLQAESPARGWQVLVDCAALPVLVGAELAIALGRVDALVSVPEAWAEPADLSARWAAWLALAGVDEAAAATLHARWRVPGDCADLAILTLRHLGDVAHAHDAASLAAVLAAMDLYRRPARCLTALRVAARVLAVMGKPMALPVQVWQSVAESVKPLAVGQVAAEAANTGRPVAQAVAAFRQQAIGQALAGLLK